MKKVLRFTKSMAYHYNKFGLSGFSFVMRKSIKRDNLLSIRVKNIKHAIYMRNYSSDVPMFYFIYDNHELDVALDYEPKVIVDCGAHIGLSAILYANHFPNATIYAIEPESSNFEMLLMNTKKYPNIICINKAIWNKSVLMEVKDLGLGNWGFITDEVKNESSSSVKSVSLNELIDTYHLQSIDLCKINIEGAEKELFEENYSQWLDKTKTIIIELHDHMKQGCSKNFFNAINNYNYSLSISGSYLLIRKNNA